jgi:hypothetical protein
MNLPYIAVKYEEPKPRKDAGGNDTGDFDAPTYIVVYVVNSLGKTVMRYATGEYERDKAKAVTDTLAQVHALLRNVQSHPSLAKFEALLKAAPNERYKYLAGADAKFRPI